MNPCNLWLGNLTLTKCKCEMLWIKLWLEKQKNAKCVQHINIMTYEKEKKHVDVLSLSEQQLCPLAERTNILYAWLPTTLFFIMGILMIFTLFVMKSEYFLENRTYIFTEKITTDEFFMTSICLST